MVRVTALLMFLLVMSLKLVDVLLMEECFEGSKLTFNPTPIIAKLTFVVDISVSIKIPAIFFLFNSTSFGHLISPLCPVTDSTVSEMARDDAMLK